MQLYAGDVARHHHERGVKVRHDVRTFVEEEPLDLLEGFGPRVLIEGGTGEVDQIVEPVVMPMRFSGSKQETQERLGKLRGRRPMRPWRCLAR